MAFSPTPSAALRYWNMARQRYCRRLARYRNTLRVSADPVAKPAAHTRAESRGSRRFESGCGRETDCPLEGGGFEPSVPGAKEPVSFAEGELRGIERRRPSKVVSLRGTDGSKSISLQRKVINDDQGEFTRGAGLLFPVAKPRCLRAWSRDHRRQSCAVSLATDGSTVTPLQQRPAARPSQARPPMPAIAIS